MKLAEILDALKAQNGVTSNAELGRILGIDKRRIGDYYGIERTPTDEDYAKIALASGIREDEIRAQVKIERAQDESERKLWAEYLKKFGGIAASFMPFICASVIFFVTSPAGNAHAATVSAPDTLYYIKYSGKIRAAIAAARRRLSIWFRPACWLDWRNACKLA